MKNTTTAGVKKSKVFPRKIKVSNEDAHLAHFMSIYEAKLKELGIPGMIQFFGVMFDDKPEENYDPWKRYTVSYFAIYYGIDKRTFEDWLLIYCPILFKKAKYTKGYRFKEPEWHQIMTKLGYCDLNEFRPHTRFDIFNQVQSLLKITEKKKSSTYATYKEALEIRITEKESKLLKFPPQRAHSIIRRISAKKYRPKFSHVQDPPSKLLSGIILLKKMDKIIRQPKSRKQAFNRKFIYQWEKFFKEAQEEIEKLKPNEEVESKSLTLRDMKNKKP